MTDAEGDVAVARVEARYAERGADARHIYESLTWGEGPGVLSQMGVQDWLWYRLPMKYLPDEPGYMGRLADVAAELFDELRLDGYAALCRSEATSGVHAAFDRSDEAVGALDPGDDGEAQLVAGGLALAVEDACRRRHRVLAPITSASHLSGRGKR